MEDRRKPKVRVELPQEFRRKGDRFYRLLHKWDEAKPIPELDEIIEKSLEQLLKDSEKND